jgi:hypothetical protein
MATLRIKDLRTITVKILPNKKRVQFRFETADGGSYESIEFELAAILALGFANETVKLLSPGIISSRSTRAQRAPRPKLRIVK